MITARIVDNGRRLVGGVVTGRLVPNELVGYLLRTVTTRACPGLVETRFALDSLCGLPDLPLQREQEGTDVKCDAISFAFGFEGAIALRGDVRTIARRASCDATPTCP